MRYYAREVRRGTGPSEWQVMRGAVPIAAIDPEQWHVFPTPVMARRIAALLNACTDKFQTDADDHP
jgi:hypothetical protein